MKLLLTTSRNASQRVRQFIKEFSFLFPKSFVQKTNRGKKSLQELFDESVDKYDRILLITNKQGNPNKIIGYSKTSDNEFIWSFEFKLRFVKLSYEFGTSAIHYPLKLNLIFENFEKELEQAIRSFFEPFIIQETSLEDENTLNVLFKHNDNGFELYPLADDRSKLAPELMIHEILIEDAELSRD